MTDEELSDRIRQAKIEAMQECRMIALETAESVLDSREEAKQRGDVEAVKFLERAQTVALAVAANIRTATDLLRYPQ